MRRKDWNKNEMNGPVIVQWNCDNNFTVFRKYKLWPNVNDSVRKAFWANNTEMYTYKLKKSFVPQNIASTRDNLPLDAMIKIKQKGADEYYSYLLVHFRPSADNFPLSLLLFDSSSSSFLPCIEISHSELKNLALTGPIHDRRQNVSFFFHSIIRTTFYFLFFLFRLKDFFLVLFFLHSLPFPLFLFCV